MWNRMDTWPITSRDLERSRSWPNYVWGPIYRKRLVIGTWSQWSTYRKWLAGNLLVTSRMTSCDPKRSRSWSRYRKMQISRKRWEIEAQYQLTTNRKLYIKNCKQFNQCCISDRYKTAEIKKKYKHEVMHQFIHLNCRRQYKCLS